MLCGLWDLSSPTRNWTWAPCSGSAESEPLGNQGSPPKEFFKPRFLILHHYLIFHFHWNIVFNLLTIKNVHETGAPKLHKNRNAILLPVFVRAWKLAYKAGIFHSYKWRLLPNPSKLRVANSLHLQRKLKTLF